MRKIPEAIVILGGTILLLLVGGTFLDWQGEMIAPFRPQLLIAALIGLSVAACLKSWKAAVIGAAALTLNGLPMAWRLAEKVTLPATHVSESQTVSVLSANVLFDNRNYRDALTMVRQEDADILIAVETGRDWVGQFDSLKDRWPHAFTAPQEGPFGLALYAKQPFRGELLHLGTTYVPLLRAEFNDYVAYVVHPMPPASAAMTVNNRVYLQQLANRVRQEHKPVIMAGDFNTTLWSANAAPILRGQWQWPHGAGLAHTWPSERPLMRIQIDHILTKGMKAGTFKVLKDIGSDHYPVRADLQF